jgi:hypothetical protein
MKTIFSLILALSIHCSAEQINCGSSKIDALNKAMEKAEYKTGEGTTVSPTSEPPTVTTWWIVGEGRMSATYIIETGVIVAMEYVMSCDVTNSTSKMTRYRVEWFDSDNGKMLINTKK